MMRWMEVARWVIYAKERQGRVVGGGHRLAGGDGCEDVGVRRTKQRRLRCTARLVGDQGVFVSFFPNYDSLF